MIADIKSVSPLIQRVTLIDTFIVDEQTYLRMRRKELRQHAVLWGSNMTLYQALDNFYPYSKKLLEYWWGLPKY